MNTFTIYEVNMLAFEAIENRIIIIMISKNIYYDIYWYMDIWF